MEQQLRDTIALVTGASRGAGRGIALALGEAGATVYVTGRSTRGADTTEGLPGTIEDTAEAVTARGGRGVAVRCDHTVDAQVDAAVARIERTHGRLDVVVSNAWGGYEGHDGAGFVAPFWEQPMSRWEGMFTAGVRAHAVTCRAAVRLMLPRRSGLIVLTTAWDHDKYLGNLFYDVAKAAVNRMAHGMARELRPHGIAALALAPGFMRTERVMAAHAREPFDLGATESPAYVGRAVVALAADARVMDRSGQILQPGVLAREYGFADVDGTRPAPFEIPDDA